MKAANFYATSSWQVIRHMEKKKELRKGKLEKEIQLIAESTTQSKWELINFSLDPKCGGGIQSTCMGLEKHFNSSYLTKPGRVCTDTIFILSEKEFQFISLRLSARTNPKSTLQMF